MNYREKTIKLFTERYGADELVSQTIKMVNDFQKSMKENKKVVNILEKTIKNKGWEIKWYKVSRSIRCFGFKGQIKVSTKATLAENDIYQEDLGKLIALSRLYATIMKIEGENDG